MRHLRTNNEFKLRVLITRGFTVFLMLFYLNLVCVQKPFCIDFYVSFFLFAGNLSKDERGSFEKEMHKRPPTELVMVR